MLPAEYASAVARVGTATGSLLAPLWRSEGLWAGKVNRAALLVSAGQVRAATITGAYMASQTSTAPEFDLVPSAFGGVASDGRPLASLMEGAAVAANAAQARVLGADRSSGTPTFARSLDMKEAAAESERAARAWLLMMARTQIADAGRAALRSSMAVWDMSGVRVANLPCCPRCAILAGRVYHWSAGFKRHPGCDCTMRPRADSTSVAEGDEIPLDQIRGLSKADRAAVDLGADLQRVVNAQRGMYTAEVYGQKVKATFDSTLHRDSLFPTRDNPNAVRLRPESILKAAGTDRDKAVTYLQRFGYIK